MSSEPTQLRVNEGEFLEIVRKISHSIAFGYKFGIYEVEDISQEIARMCWEALPDWDGVRPLYNFLLCHAHNRLKNLKRDEWFRATCPCKLCNNKAEGETGHEDKGYCAAYKEWKVLNSRKCNLALPQSLGEKFDAASEELVVEDIIDKEDKKYWERLIDIELPVELRGSYLRMKSGISIPQNERDAILSFLKELMTRANKK